MILNGRETAQKIKANLKGEIEKLKNRIKKVPNLAVIQVGDDPASQIYVNSKIKQCSEVGIESKAYIYPITVTEDEILAKIEELNRDKTVNGILVQLPLPKHIDEMKVIDKIALEKDVDGFKPENIGLLSLNRREALLPCTPAGIMRLFKEYSIELEGKDIVVIGRSNIVGKPLSLLLINSGATVTVCNSKTKNLKEKTKSADIVIVAVGKANFLTEDMVKDGVIVVDVGINRDGKKICGDVDFETVSKKSSYITPVPGGVGPMTIALLLENTVKSFKNIEKVKGE